ncbi:hypothetical protein ATO12_11220 [Aquimarina atlantica]|uniref:Uncharacterized protein n=2 Tax=Aquimarina atlantica TaxID=1317122 RepID=A0A023BWJ0_9FLAO|nr:hypothetical protein ATO12_11220 [Aquimarina atlantica]
MLLAIAVLIISGAALIVSMRQASIMNKQTDILLEQTKSSAWPRLSVGFDQSWSDKTLEYLKIPVHNKGTGPAIIEGVRITYNGEVTKDWWDLFRKVKVPDSINTGISNRGIYNSVISANESFYWMQLENDPRLRHWVYEKKEKITIEICYKSVFNDYWLFRKEGLNGTTVIQKLDTPECPLPSDEMFKS